MILFVFYDLLTKMLLKIMCLKRKYLHLLLGERNGRKVIGNAYNSLSFTSTFWVIEKVLDSIMAQSFASNSTTSDLVA